MTKYCSKQNFYSKLSAFNSPDGNSTHPFLLVGVQEIQGPLLFIVSWATVDLFLYQLMDHIKLQNRKIYTI